MKFIIVAVVIVLTIQCAQSRKILVRNHEKTNCVNQFCKAELNTCIHDNKCLNVIFACTPSKRPSKSQEKAAEAKAVACVQAKNEPNSIALIKCCQAHCDDQTASATQMIALHMDFKQCAVTNCKSQLQACAQDSGCVSTVQSCAKAAQADTKSSDSTKLANFQACLKTNPNADATFGCLKAHCLPATEISYPLISYVIEN